MGTGEPDALEPLDLARSAQQLAEGLAVAELDAVGVDVLTQQRDLDRAVVDEQADLLEDVARPAVPFLAAQARHDAERAGVVASDRDRDPAAVDRIPLRRERRGEDVEGLENLQLCLAVVAGAFEEGRERPHVVGAEDDIDPGSLVEHGLLVHLRQASADGDLHAVLASLDGGEMTECSVELARCVVADRTGVDDDDVGLVARRRPDVAGALERAGETFGVVHVHLAAERPHLVRAHAPVGGARGVGRRDDGRRGRGSVHDASILRGPSREGLRPRQRMRARMRAAASPTNSTAIATRARTANHVVTATSPTERSMP